MARLERSLCALPLLVVLALARTTLALPSGGAPPAALSDPGAARADAGISTPRDDSGRDSGSAWQGSVFIWDNSASLETVGLGRDVQSRNPTYEMSFRIAPRYTLFDDPRRTIGLHADVALIREFTNSDRTTRRGEWTLTDTELWLRFSETLRRNAGSRTEWVLRAPSLRLPTSNASLSNGTILGVGAGVGLDQRVILAGERAPILARALLRPRLGYMYQFVLANVPTNDSIERVRLTPAGRSLPSDQLSGTAFPEHEISASVSAETDVLADFGLILEVGMRYARRYALADRERVCGVVDTGCISVGTSVEAPRWGVATLFAIEASYFLVPALSLGLGYANLSGQLGADGQRGSVFYGPDARISLSATLNLDAAYGTLFGGAAGSTGTAAAWF